MKALVVLTFNLPNADAVIDVTRSLDPPNVPHFAGDMRVVVDPHASQLEEWLDEEE